MFYSDKLSRWIYADKLQRKGRFENNGYFIGEITREFLHIYLVELCGIALWIISAMNFIRNVALEGALGSPIARVRA